MPTHLPQQMVNKIVQVLPRRDEHGAKNDLPQRQFRDEGPVDARGDGGELDDLRGQGGWGGNGEGWWGRKTRGKGGGGDGGESGGAKHECQTTAILTAHL